ncbi:nuclear transport factor 2 family protein [Salibacterium aidingense]|uniref:nuclear transport factor 2 family protein n=1 Tax=Salibacterium aidingense TaxID=384933 RepID=UPI00041C5E2D|nr:nuclear transport factor 2 family protein [Salibacterium aidingense]
MGTKNQEFIRAFNEAFAREDVDYLIENVSEDVVWTMVGTPPIKGKSAFAGELKKMKSGEAWELEIHHIITHGDTAAVDGTIKKADKQGKTYAFCDIYRLSAFKNGKVKELTSYVVEVR